MSCLNCKSRYIGCHDNCNDYKEYVKSKGRKMAKEREYEWYLHDAIERMKRSRRR